MPLGSASALLPLPAMNQSFQELEAVLAVSSRLPPVLASAPPLSRKSQSLTTYVDHAQHVHVTGLTVRMPPPLS